MEAASVCGLTVALTGAGCAGWFLSQAALCSAIPTLKKLASLRNDPLWRDELKKRLTKRAREWENARPALKRLKGRVKSSRRDGQLRREMPQVIRLLCISLDSGASLVQALEYAAEGSNGQMSRELKRAVWDLESGRSFSEAMKSLRRRTNGSEFDCLIVAMEIQHMCGGSLGAILESVSQMLQQTADLEEELVTKTTQARLSAKVVALMPLVVLLLLSLASPGFLGQFFESAAGVALLILALLLEAVGVVLVRRTLASSLGAGGT